jgi:rhamnosyltransferase subunit B
VRAEGLEFGRMGTAAQHDRVHAHADMWHPERGPQLFFEYAVSVLPEGHAAIKRLTGAGPTVLAAGRLAFAARVAHTSLRVPLLTVLHIPALLPSRNDPPPPGGGIDEGPVLKPINRFRSELNLAPVRQLGPWMLSPRLVIALWPDWFYDRQDDWPGRVVTSSFVSYDGTGAGPDVIPERPALVFAAGTANIQAREFFLTAARLCRSLALPGMLVTQHPSQIPADLPPDVRHVPFTPFARLLPRMLAIVHHGGIGTSARALAAGIPQLVVPNAYDQFDNARRLVRLGVGLSVSRGAFTVDIASQALRRLLGDPTVAERCAHWAEELRTGDAVDVACRLIENAGRPA